MDPDACLAKIRLLCSQSETASLEVAAHNYDELAEAFTSLDEWLKLRGFPPKDWARREVEFTHSFDMSLNDEGKARGECLQRGNAPFWFQVTPVEKCRQWVVKCWHCHATVEPPWHLYELDVH